MADPGAARRWRIGAVVAVLALLIAALTAEGYSWSRFHQSLGAAGPDRIHVCGREYLGPGRAMTFAAVRSGMRVPISQVGTVATLQGGRAVWAGFDPRADGAPCGTAVWLRTGKDTLHIYGLSGGP